MTTHDRGPSPLYAASRAGHRGCPRRVPAAALAVVLGVAGIFVLFFGLYPTPLLSLAAHASAVLF